MQGIQKIIDAAETAFSELDSDDLNERMWHRVGVTVSDLVGSLTRLSWQADNLGE